MPSDVSEFGPHVLYEDPRIYVLMAGYAWGPHQREMLLGTRAWPQTQNAMSIVDCFRERGIQVGFDGAGGGPGSTCPACHPATTCCRRCSRPGASTSPA